MSDDLPVPHGGVPNDDPLEAENTQKAVGVTAETERLALAIGDESMEEWIRFEGEAMEAER